MSRSGPKVKEDGVVYDANYMTTFCGVNIPAWLKSIMMNHIRAEKSSQTGVVCDALVEYFTKRYPDKVREYVKD